MGPLQAETTDSLTLQQNQMKKSRTGASVNVYLILQKGDHVLLHLRKNTGYGDGYYGLISGHVEDHESADYILDVLRDIKRGQLYSEKGWTSA